MDLIKELKKLSAKDYAFLIVGFILGIFWKVLVIGGIVIAGIFIAVILFKKYQERKKKNG